MQSLFSKLYWLLHPFSDFTPTNAFHADSPGVYTSEENFEFNYNKKKFLKCDVFDGSVVNGLRYPILYSFVFR